MSAIRRVITGVSGSPRDLPALRYAAALAYGQDAPLMVVHAWSPGGELAYSRSPYMYLLSEEKRAKEALKDALANAFGGLPAHVSTQPVTARGEAGRILVDVADRAGDLLVIGAGRRGAIRRLAAGKTSRYCLAHASCPVLAVPPSPLERNAGHGLHGRAFRHRGRNLDELTASS